MNIYVFDEQMDLQWFAGDSLIEFEEEYGDSSEVIFWENRFNYSEFYKK